MESAYISGDTIDFDPVVVSSYLESQEIHATAQTVRSFYQAMLSDAFERLMKTTLIGEVRLDKRERLQQPTKPFAILLKPSHEEQRGPTVAHPLDRR